MPTEDRRIVPRKPYVMPIRFIVLSEEFAIAGNLERKSAAASETLGTVAARSFLPYQGETVNLSERGVRFKSQQAICLGQTVELFFTLPTELTGRTPEDVRCTAKVVHVDQHPDIQGRTSVGASIERFEHIAPVRTWGN